MSDPQKSLKFLRVVLTTHSIAHGWLTHFENLIFEISASTDPSFHSLGTDLPA